MTPIEMRNLTTFPIERLCFDLKVEVLEQLETKDVVELVKVNQGFQWMISNRPSIVFGHHVDDVGFLFEELKIKKLNSESRGVSLDVIRHFPFIKDIHSCNQFSLVKRDHDPIGKNHIAFLKQLEAVNSLDLFCLAPQHLELLSHLSMKIGGYARLPSFLKEAPSLKDLVGHCIETQFNESVGRIFFNYDDFEEDMKATVCVFFKGCPGMKQIYGKNRRPFVALTNDHDKGSGDDQSFTMKALCFRQNINTTRDCIYILSFDQFLAFYIKPDEIIDH